MAEPSLKNALRSMVQEHGFDLVNESLQEIGFTELHIENPKGNTTISSKNVDQQNRKKKSKTTAPQYVAKMPLPSEKETSVLELAEKFQAKLFLPTMGDISNFCQAYRIDEPSSKSRANAMPRVFKLIASMDASDIQYLLDSGMFSGPSRLGPIADAIRNNGRANADAPTGKIT